MTTSSKTETPSDFQFSFFVFIFWTSFQVPIFKSVKKLLQTLEPVKGGFKTLKIQKISEKAIFQPLYRVKTTFTDLQTSDIASILSLECNTIKFRL